MDIVFTVTIHTGTGSELKLMVLVAGTACRDGVHPLQGKAGYFVIKT